MWVSHTRLAFRLYFLGFNKLAPCVRPAAQTFDSGLRAQRVITGVIIGHHVATITIEQACRHLLRAAGGVVKKDHWFIWRAAGLHPHPGLAAWVSVGSFNTSTRVSSQWTIRLPNRLSRIKFSSGWKCSPHWITQRANVWRGISTPWRPKTFSKR